MADTDKKLSAVYVSWPTMKNALDQLSQGVHSRIDRSVFPGLAWSIQNQLFSGMKFLGLMTMDGDSTKELEDLVSGDENDRKQKLKAILEHRYAELFALDLMKTTPAQLLEKMGELYGVSGDTREKSVRFFLGAAEYVGMKMSPLFGTRKTNGSSTPRRKKSSNRVKSDSAKSLQTPSGTEQIGSPGGTSKTVNLKSGGTLKISASLDLFSLNTEDRTFVFSLIDKLEAYEKGSA